MEELSTLYFAFWSQFCAAFQDTVPLGTSFPYLTYSVVCTPFNEQTITGVNIYDNATSVSRIRSIGAEIERVIKPGGIWIPAPVNKGMVFIARANPFIQSRSLPPDEVAKNIRSDYVSIIIRTAII